MLASLRLWIAGNKLLAIGGAVALLLIVGAATFAAIRHGGVKDERARQEAATAAATLEAVTDNAAALEQSSIERAAAVASSAETERSLNDASRSLPDARPSDRRRAFNCQRVRNDARANRADFPECFGPDRRE